MPVRFSFTVKKLQETVNNSNGRNTTVFRYVRPQQFDPTRNEVCHSPAGGISFRFDFDHNLNIIRFCFVRCPATVKFCHDLAKKQLAAKVKANQTYLLLALSKDLSLIQNVERFISSSKQKELVDLLKHLKQLRAHNAKVQCQAKIFYSDITEKVKVEYELT